MKLFLLGLMGSGKTFWKNELAAKLKLTAYDLDQLIVAIEEASIPEIFEREGEIYFRKTEAKILKWFGEKKSFVLATGGGTPCFHQNMEWMNQQGITIWLDEPVSVLTERLKNETANRPLLKNLDEVGLQRYLERQLTDRTPFYNLAKIRLSGNQINLKSLLLKIKEYA
ncbi:shikimate kinase [Sediminibacterium sp. TEGAF015]|uniref:shikimate kinase n=1 Tax=Sediminibacterium sp. TEGAF015 TaxID=575378 RepID=UPI0021FE61A4|nr:shikimate kinase [Sediminibacterium sp. TEGAF015]BDQ11465.1 shikimate kinase [Sediminibacterium sp. TEGAF015]